MTTAIVLDIEGTTSPTSAVREDLYGYTRARLPEWLARHRDDAAAPILAATRELAGRPDADTDEVARILREWLGSDVKAEPLKEAQGLICHEGFATGALHGEFFPDVPPALRAWHAAGHRLCVYSSGSLRNQRDWFAHARGGELGSLISAHFDLTTAGPKREAGSYRRIAEALGVEAGQLLFLSDHADELDAAVAAGWSAVGVHRPGEPNPPRPPHRWIGSFDELDLARTPVS
ncbi:MULTISPECIES: acireductone synthase [Nocardia]|uniref:Enolase-phosphatase E1 n=1 Tax=Nocardia farcinica TaxID=37329 RepID=A0A0H5P6E8_NOCFR|nr:MULTISPECIES: acireductone synthase [Nocardia]AXK88114.1 acireductone synthase [Nocardia farcinica]MBA4854856.1 acireductone synthase [Nocardia farcinica]MBC9814981.1 acireductone synthase [Nocardia farcinica]MBF6141765.1 acireductone synthase [Nocardia farcinica]MBF6247028.1 acireductone synthase [Nocardia elegans]